MLQQAGRPQAKCFDEPRHLPNLDNLHFEISRDNDEKIERNPPTIVKKRKDSRHNYWDSFSISSSSGLKIDPECLLC